MSVKYQAQQLATPPNGLQVQTRTSTDGGEVQAVYLDGSNLISIQDGGGSITVDGAVNTTPVDDYYFRAARGLVSGVSNVDKFGASLTVGTTLAPVALANAYLTPSTLTSLEVLSSSANDTDGGTGAQTVTITGIGDGWVQVSETVTMNGTAAVALANQYYRIYRWFVASSGTYANSAAGSHVGTLTIRAAGGGATWSQINTTPFPVGQSQIACYTVPLGKTGYINSFDIEPEATKTLDVLFFQRPNANDVTAPYTGTMRLVERWTGINQPFYKKHILPLGPFVGPCDVGYMAKTSVGSAAVTCNFEMTLVDS